MWAWSILIFSIVAACGKAQPPPSWRPSTAFSPCLWELPNDQICDCSVGTFGLPALGIFVDCTMKNLSAVPVWNAIANFPGSEGLTLYGLDLSYNKIHTLQSDAFNIRGAWLFLLNLSFNDILYLDEYSLTNISSSDAFYLSIAENPAFEIAPASTDCKYPNCLDTPQYRPFCLVDAYGTEWNDDVGMNRYAVYLACCCPDNNAQFPGCAGNGTINGLCSI